MPGEEFLLPLLTKESSSFSLPLHESEENIGAIPLPNFVASSRIFSFQDLMSGITHKLNPSEANEMKNLLAKAHKLVSNGERGKIMFTNFAYSFTAEDVCGHGEKGWASDATVNSFLSMMSMVEKETAELSGCQPKVFYISTLQFIFKEIGNGCWEKVSLFLGKRSIMSYLDFDKIVIAHHLPDHWVFYTIFVKVKKFGYYDSFNDKPSKDADPRMLIRWMEKISSLEGKPFNRSEWTVDLVYCPHQVILI